MTTVAAIADPGVLAAALDGLGDGVLVVRGREVLVANRAAHRMTGRADGTLVGAAGAGVGRTGGGARRGARRAARRRRRPPAAPAAGGGRR